MSEVGVAWVELKPSAKGFGTATVKQVSAETEKSGRSLGSKFGSALKVGAVAAVGGGIIAAKFLAGAVQQASDLNETGSKIGVIFGKAAPALKKFAGTGATELGQTKQDVLDAAATFGTFGQAAGLQGPKLAKFSRGLVSLSTDLASFFNTDPTQASEAIGAALRGEGEPIRQYGVLLDDATLKAEALRLGILKPVKDKSKILAYQTNVLVAQKAYNKAVADSGKGSLDALKAQAHLGTAQASLKKATEGTIPTLTQQQKVLAAQSSIMRQTKNAQGDFSRTSGGLANQQRILSASFDNLKTRVGKLFLPIVTKVVTFLNSSAVPVVRHFLREIESGQGAGGKFAAAFGPVKNALTSIPWAKIGNAIGTIKLGPLSNAVEGTDWSKLSNAVASIDVSKLKKAFSKGVNNTISVFSVLIGFAADHVDTLAKYLPALIAAFIAYKSAAALANAVEITRLPILAANVLATLASASANKALAKAITSSTTQITAATSVEKVSMLTRLRATFATIASTVAQKAAAAAAKAWAVTQWLLNAALSANPIGLIIIGIVALVAALILAWKKSDTFKAIVTKAFEFVAKIAKKVFGYLSSAVAWVIGFIRDHWKLLLGIIGGPFVAIVLLVVTHWDKIKHIVSTAVDAVLGFVKSLGRGILDRLKEVAKFVGGVKDKFTAVVLFVGKIPGRVIDALGDLGSTLLHAGEDLIQGLIDGIMNKFDDVKDAVGKVAGVVGKFWPGSPIKEGPLKSWNNGGAGKRLVGMLAQGLAQTSPVDAAARNLASRVRLDSVALHSSDVADVHPLAHAARGGVQIHVEHLQPHDYRAFMGDMQRRTQRVALGGFA